MLRRDALLAGAIALALVLPWLAPTAMGAPLNLAQAGGGVVFSFDSGYASGVVAAQTLASHGLKGTFYVVSSFLRQGPYYTAFMSASDLVNLSNAGHDIESMTVTKPDLSTLSPTQLAAELSNSKAALANIIGKPVNHLAYPYGSASAAVETAAASYYASARGLTTTTSSFTTSVNGLHVPGLVITQSTTLATAKSHVDYAIANNVFVVFSFGAIVNNPGTWDWTPANLDALAAYVKSKGIPVRTISQLVAGVAPPPPPPPPNNAGTVVFTIDDGGVSNIAAAQVLANHGMRMTFYIISKCSSSEVDTDTCMTNSQVEAANAAGHDIESHTVRHRDLTTLNAKTRNTELRDSQRALEELTERPVEHIAYPYGSHNPTVRADTANYYMTGRIYLANPAPSNLPNLLAQSGADPYLIPGIGVTKATTLTNAKAYIDYAKTSGATIVLSFHDIVSSGGDAYSWTPSNFAALVDYTAASGVTVKTMAQRYG